MNLIALLFTVIPGFATLTSSPPDRPVLSHCGALLLARSVHGVTNQGDARRILRDTIIREIYLEDEAGRRLPYHGQPALDSEVGVRLGIDGENMAWPNGRTARMLERSVVRLRQLELDLDRPMDVLSVIAEVRGAAAIHTFIRRHQLVVRNLDADVNGERRARQCPSDEGSAKLAVAGLGSIGSGVFVYATDALDQTSSLGAGMLGLIGAVCMMKPTEDVIHRLRDGRPIRSARRDEVDRFFTLALKDVRTPGLHDGLAHVGFTVMVSEDLGLELRRVSEVNALNADVLLDAERETKPRRIGVDRRARLSIDHLFINDERTGEPVLLNIARLTRPRHKPSTGGRRLDLRRLSTSALGSY